MSDLWETPPDRDLPSGRLAERREHLVLEIRQMERRETPISPKGRRNWPLRVAMIGGAAAVVAFIVLGLGPRWGPGAPDVADARIEVQSTGDHYEIGFVQLGEDASRVEQELSALGLDVSLDFVPVSPSLEGSLVASAGGDGTERYSVDVAGVPTLRIPLDYGAALALTIGRPGVDGERYVSTPALGAEAPGEALHCSDIFSAGVAEASAILEERGLDAEWRNDKNEVRSSDDLAGYFVVQTTPIERGKVLVWTAPEPLLPDPRPAEVIALLASGCS